MLLLSGCDVGVGQVFGPTATPVVVVIVATADPAAATSQPAPTALPDTATPVLALATTEATVAAVPTAAATAVQLPTSPPDPTAPPAATAAPAANQTALCVAGSNTILGSDTKPMQQAWISTLSDRFNITLSIDGSGTEAGIDAAISGGCVDALLASEPLNSGQVQALAAAGVAAGEPTVIASDVIAFATDQNTQVPSLSIAQLRDILNGKVTNWSEVRGQAQPLTVLLRPGSGTTNYVLINVAQFEPFVTVPGQPFPPNLKYTECGNPGGNRACLDQVGSGKGLLYWAARYLVRGDGLRAIPIAGTNGPVDPTSASFSVENYPKELVRPLFLYKLDRKGGDADARLAADIFQNYLLSERGQQTLIEQGFSEPQP